jgi:hypothetical protein
MINHKIKGNKFTEHQLNTNSENFPLKSFYNPAQDEIYVVYRQGEAFTIQLKDLDDFYVQTIGTEPIGSIFHFGN